MNGDITLAALCHCQRASLHIAGRKMGAFINSLGSFINQYANKCRKFGKVAQIVSVRVMIKVKFSIFGNAAI